MLCRWVRKIKIVTGVPCSTGTKMMAESSAQLGLNENDESHDLQLLGEKIMTTSTSTPDRPISIKSESSKQLVSCTILKEHLGRIALAFLSSQGIFSSEELLNRSLSVRSANSPLTKALYEWRFEQDNDPKPSPKLRTQQVSYIEI